ncbi:excitatory amino acid transporter 2 [Culicoides brevitarsis]|uniref:excitatory amino acid transporter 2 n=1 Tax=Culicoides brevitarsis TaxID=469753 RepID=UPI00307C9252
MCKIVKKHKMLIFTLFAVAIGVILGFFLRNYELHKDTILLISYPGELFMRCLNLIILPLIVASLIAGTASLDINMNGKIALRTFVLICLTSFFNSIMGVVLVLLIRPGSFKYIDGSANNLTFINTAKKTYLTDSLLDLGRNIIPDNLFQATFQSTQTLYEANNTGDLIRKISYRSGTNTLGLVFFCTAFGIAVGMTGNKGKIIKDFFEAVFNVIMKLVNGVMWLTPICVGSIITGKLLDVPDVKYVLTQLMWFVITVVIGLALYQFVVMQLLYLCVLKKNPFKFYGQLLNPMLTSAACASTAAALPVTFQVMDNDIKIDPRITKFVLPIGCNSNMDGTAVMVGVSSIFIAQMNGIELTVGQIFTITILAFTSSLAVSSIPSSALIMVMLVLNTLSIPTQDVMLLFAIDWFVDRLRTTNNMLSDCYIAAVVENLSKKDLASLDETEMKKIQVARTK